MGIDRTRDNEAYGLSQPLIGVPNKPIVSDRNPTAHDKGQLGQIWVNPTVNSAYILVSNLNNAAVWAIYATPIAGNLVVGGTITAGLGFISLAGGANITGNSTFNNNVAITGNLTVPLGDITANAGTISASSFVTITDPTMGLTLNSNGIYASGSNPVVDVEVIPTAGGAFVIDGLFGSPLVSVWKTAQSWVQTLAGVQTTLLSLPVAAEQVIIIQAFITGFKSTYDHALGGQILISAASNAGGVVQQIGNKTVSSYTDAGATAGVSVNANVVGNTLQLLVTGAAGETWNWVTTYSYMYTTHP
jgi:hypothetical protein